MAELKTKPNDQSVEEYLHRVENEQKRQDCFTILSLMKEVTGHEPKMWGDSLVGFGSYDYKYKSVRGGTWFLTGFAPRKQNLTLYIMPGFDRYADQLARLGKHKHAKSCLYIKKLADVDLDVLRELVTLSVEQMSEYYPDS